MLKIFIAIIISLFSLPGYCETNRLPKNIVYVVYFTGMGCPHCAKVDPVLLRDTVRSKNVMVIEYEIYKQRENARLLIKYSDRYKTDLGIPLIIAGDTTDKTISGDFFILHSLDNFLQKNKNNKIVLPNSDIDFVKLDLAKLPKLPKIWYKSRVAIKKDINSTENNTIKEFIINKTIPKDATAIKYRSILLAESKIRFKQAVEFNGWWLMYN
jgi:thiol-disulfide isomerase/thioredoxin